MNEGAPRGEKVSQRICGNQNLNFLVVDPSKLNSQDVRVTINQRQKDDPAAVHTVVSFQKSYYHTLSTCHMETEV